MAVTTSRRRRTQSGVSLLLTSMSLVFIIPMLGLMVDVGVLYSVRSRLQSSVDGASLAAARALNLGQTTGAQATAAKQNAVNWFYANFPAGNWSTTSTTMDQTTVNVFDDPGNPNLRNVTVTATTMAPTFFMKWFGTANVMVTASGNASRRDVVAMMVLDRSGSMCVPGSSPCSGVSNTACGSMVTAAKLFTGQFAAGRDQIGLISFSDGTYVHSAPTTNFQTTLGYSNSFGSSSGQIDQIACNGGTGTAQAVSLAYNEIFKKALPGAYNFIMLETDGLPNTLTYNFWDGAAAGINAGSSCTDSASKTYANNGWRSLGSMRNWTAGYNMNSGGTGFMANIPAGSIGGFYTADPAQGTYQIVMFDPWQAGANNSTNNSKYVAGSGPGCKFVGGGNVTDTTDINWLPGSDVFGNSVKPANAYLALTLSGGHVDLTNTAATDWPKTHAAALNATENAAYRARTNATLPVSLFIVGLGGANGDPPDPILLQRMANDPDGDQFNNPAKYSACSLEPTCVNYPTQPPGTFIFAPNRGQLGSAFLALSSQVLRLSH